MPDDRLEHALHHIHHRLENDPPSTRLETRPLVDDLLTALGWPIYECCLFNVSLGGLGLECDYICTHNDVPAVLVALEPATDGLSRSRTAALGTAMTRTGIDRAVYTNGHEIVLLAGTGPVETESGSLEDPHIRQALLEHYTNDTLAPRLERHTRAVTGRRLALERSRLEDDIVDLLTTVSGDPYTAELERATTRFLDSVLEAFVEPTSTSVSAEPPAETVSYDEASSGAELSVTEDAPGETEGADTAAGRATSESGDAVPSGDETAPETEDPVAESTTADGEYVVRFFGEHGSVGAIGHSSSAGALVHAVEFLFERGLSGIRVPWPAAEREGAAIDLDEPQVLVGPDGTDALEGARGPTKTLSNGYVLNVSGDESAHRERLEALADRAGYRVMMTGDWEG